MKHFFQFLAAAFITSALFLACTTAPKERAFQPSEKVAQDFIRRFPDPDSIHWRGQTNHFSWQAGYIMFAMEKMWRWTGDSVYFNYIKRYVDQQVDDAGNIPDFKDDALDNFLPGYAILFMYEETGSDKYLTAATTIKEAFKTYSRSGNGLFWHSTQAWARGQVWIDGVFMGQIFLARYGAVAGDNEYAFTEVTHQITEAARIMQKENGLLLHGWDESKKARWADPGTGLSPEVWSEGVGWYAVLMADVFDYLPENWKRRDELMQIHRDLCTGIKASQDEYTGMWSQVVDRPYEAGNWNETSGTAMFVYLLQKSINDGRISKEEYQPVVDKAYPELLTRMQKNEAGYIDLIDCSSIGVMGSYEEYISQPKEVSPFAAFGSYLVGTGIYDFDR